jgi:hypothetical protein
MDQSISIPSFNVNQERPRAKKLHGRQRKAKSINRMTTKKMMSEQSEIKRAESKWYGGCGQSAEKRQRSRVTEEETGTSSGDGNDVEVDGRCSVMVSQPIQQGIGTDRMAN